MTSMSALVRDKDALLDPAIARASADSDAHPGFPFVRR